MASPSPPATKASPPPPSSDGGNTTSPPPPSDKSPSPPPPSPPAQSPPQSPPAQSPPQSPPESPPKSPPSSPPPPPPSSTPPPPSTPPPSPPSPPPSPPLSPPPPPPSPTGSSPPPPENGDSASPSPPNSTPQAPPKSGSQDNNDNSSSSSGALPSPPRSSPKHGKSSSSGDNNHHDGPPAKRDDQSSGGSNNAIVIGVVAGLALFILLISVSALVSYCRRRKNRKAGDRDYYNNNGSAPPKWQGQGVNHNIKIPPPPGMGGPPGGGWQHGPPAPMSSDMSSPSYSGPHGPALPPPSPTLSLGFNKSTFTYEELAAATGGFSQSNMIGQGGFGYVFRGVLPNGKDVAVKQLKSGSGQGEREFQAEVEIISRVHHRHLVSLVGYCITGAQRLLVYEFVPNKTLEYHLHGKGLPTMDWPTRMKIAIGSAKGLAYLHEDCHPRIIHRDIKTANILLDYKFEAMVADFGLAKLSSDTNTHVSTRVMGTFGYLAPEYASSGKLTEKSDVFSYGVMLLELISGRRPVDHTNRMEDSLVDWARPILGQIVSEENYGEVADPNLEGNYNPPEMARMMACAAACVRHSARKRPKMSQVVRALEGDMISFDDLNEGVKPGQSSVFGSSGSESTFESTTYSSKMREFKRVALASGEYTGEYSGVTSEYGLNPSESSSSSGETQFGAGRKPRQEV